MIQAYRWPCVGIALLVLTSCGGDSESGGSSTVPIVVAPAPTPTPSPTPTAPSSSTLSLITPGLAGANPSTSLDPLNAMAFRATLTEPDVAALSRFEDINFDGDEGIEVRHTAAVAPYAEAFPASSFQGRRSNGFYVGSSNERFLPALAYQTRLGGPGSAILVLPLLEEVRKTALSATTTGNVTEHVRLLDVRPSSTRGFQLIGTRTAAGELPASGVRTMVGESTGVRYSSNQNVQDYLGDSVLMVDFGRKVVTGTINISQFLGSTPVRPALVIEIVADIAGDGSLSGKITVRGTGVFEAGYLTGALYGASADEIGIVLTSSGESGSILGGLVAGQE